MKHNAIRVQHRHFDSEIQIAALSELKWEEIKPQVDHVIWPNGKAHHRAGQGPAGEPRLRHRASELRDEQLVQATRPWPR